MFRPYGSVFFDLLLCFFRIHFQIFVISVDARHPPNELGFMIGECLIFLYNDRMASFETIVGDAFGELLMAFSLHVGGERFLVWMRKWIHVFGQQTM